MMKKMTNTSPVLRKVAVTVTAILAVLLVAAIPVRKFAKFIKDKKAASAGIVSESQFNVQYIGSDKNTFTFKVDFDNYANQKFAFVVKDEKGNILYRRRSNNEHLSDTIQIIKDDSNAFRIYPVFEVKE